MNNIKIFRNTFCGNLNNFISKHPGSCWKDEFQYSDSKYLRAFVLNFTVDLSVLKAFIFPIFEKCFDQPVSALSCSLQIKGNAYRIPSLE